MITINAAFGQEEKVLGTLGRIGENETRQIVFDCSDILAEYPGAEIVCVMQRHCDRTAYLADAVLAGNVLTVTLTDADVSAPGDLRIELRALADGKIRKSAVYMGQVVSALRGAQDRPGNPIADVLNRIDSTLQSATETQKNLLSALDGVATAVDGANSAASAANTAATAATNAANAANSGETARVAAEKNRANAETARANAETARANAETQRANAEGARATAEQGRVAAEQGRVAAEQERATAEAARETAEAARRAALGGLSFAVNEDDGGLDTTYTYTETEG